MSAQDDVIINPDAYTALLLGSAALHQAGQHSYAGILTDLANDAYTAYKEAMQRRDRDRQSRKFERIVGQWERDVRSPLNPLEKNYVHRVHVTNTPDRAWLVEHVRVPFRFYRDGTGRLFFPSRCPREAVAV